jgi:hypothetical protein
LAAVAAGSLEVDDVVVHSSFNPLICCCPKSHTPVRWLCYAFIWRVSYANLMVDPVILI